MDKDNPISVDEIKSRSDMVTLFDAALERLDNEQYAIVITISKKGGVQIAAAGIASQLELNGLIKIAPEMIEEIMDKTFGCDGCDGCDKEEDG